MTVGVEAKTGNVDLRPLVGLLSGVPNSMIEHLALSAMIEHRTLVAKADNLFDALPAEVRSGAEAAGGDHLPYLEATIAMHAQMSVVTTLLGILGYTPKASAPLSD